MLQHLLSYVLSEHIIFSHVISGGLLFGLFRHGTSLPKVVLLGMLQEALCSFMWWLTPDSVKGLGVVALLYLTIKVYERLTGPRVKVNEGAVFIAGKSVADALQSVSPLIVFTEEPHQDGQVLLHTNLVYAEYWLSFWSGPAGKWAIDMGDVHTADEGCERAIIKSIRDAGIDPSQCFNLRVGDDLSVTCAAETSEIRDQWVEGFRRLLGNRLEHYKAQTINRMFDEMSIQGEGETRGVSLDGILHTLEKFGRIGHKPYTKEIYSTFAKISATKSVDGEPILTKETFGKYIELALKRPEIHQIYERLLIKNKSEVSLSPQRLRDFLADEQKEQVSFAQCKEWISQWESIIPFNSFSSVGFTSFLLSDDQAILDRKCHNVYQDMTQPLPHYFIATSHNTYLTKDQLKGKSSVDAYITAFKKGCKCVELDCWDGPNNEPIIYHGHTLTSKILFKDVIVAIRDYAFAVSKYPVILSFENHCSLEQQRVMASHLINILGDTLYTKSIPEDETQFPSPQALMGYVIVKSKKLKEGATEADDFEDETDDESDSEDGEEKVNDKKQKEKEKSKEKEKEKEDVKDHEKVNGFDKKDGENYVNGDVTEDDKVSIAPFDKASIVSESGLERRGSSTSLSNRFSSLMKTDFIRADSKKKKKPPKIAQELSDLVFYCQAVHFKSFADSKESSKYYQMSSFGEKKALRLGKEELTSFIEYNRRQLSRIYPAGSRVDSSNYDPQPLWNVGCQLVALNYQTPCKSMQLNQGLFQDNGYCGYVLKPEILRLDNTTFDPHVPSDDNKVRFLMIRVISGIQLPYSNENKVRGDRNLLVQLQIRGVDSDNHKEKTKVVKNNGYNPTWNEMIGFKLHVCELAMLTFTVREGDNFLGQYTLPVRCIQKGYRRVPLQNKHSETIPYASLFVHTDLKEPI